MHTANVAVLASIVAKGFGVLLAIFLAGIVVGVALTASVTIRIQRFRSTRR
ncbi:MAG: hypothetical protein ACYDAD_13410 [Acidimicrobiales bacterium]